jgi:hypothetical protein
MYLWAAAIFFLVYKVELYIEDDDEPSRSSSRSERRRQRPRHSSSHGRGLETAGITLPCLPAVDLERRVDICEVDSDDGNPKSK